MPTTMTHLRALLAERHAGAATEYGMIAGIICIGIAGAFSTLSSKLTTAFSALNF